MIKFRINHIVNVLEILVFSFFVLCLAGSINDKIPPSQFEISYQSTEDSISLFWTASTDASGIRSYTVYRDSEELGTTKSTGYLDTGLQEYTFHTYTIISMDNAGNSRSNTITAATIDLNPPTAPSALTYSATSGSISLSWTASTDTGGLAGYYIYKNDEYLGFTTSTTYTFNGLNDYTDYILKVSAVDRAGKITSNQISAQTIDSTPPSEPTDLSYTATTDSTFLSWTASTDNGIGMGIYKIYRNNTLIGSTEDTSYTDTGLDSNTDYTYKIEAYDKSNNGPSGSSINVHTYDDTIKVLSFNINMNISNSSIRIPAMIDYLSQYKPDIIGSQEMAPFWFKKLSPSMTDYSSVGGTDEKTVYECTIFYLKDKYDLVDSGNDWLGKAYGKGLANNQDKNRLCTWAVLRDKVTGKEFAVINTHLDDGMIYDYSNDTQINAVLTLRKSEAEGVMSKINELKKSYNVPIVCTGDFNENQSVSNGVYSTMTSGIMKDACTIAGKTTNTGITFHDSNTVKSNQSFDGLPIDFCFVNSFKVLSYEVTRDSYSSGNGSNIYPSDHFGVLVQLKPQ